MARSLKIVVFPLMFILLAAGALASLNVTMADQGTGIITSSSGASLDNGNLEVTIWDALSGGNLIYNETFSSAIDNGSWNVMLGVGVNLPLDYGATYYKDYRINGEDVSFTNNTGGSVARLEFVSSLGQIGDEDVNLTTSSSGNSTFLTNSTNSIGLSIADDLNVGIGTTSPNGILNIVDTQDVVATPSANADALVIENGNVATGITILAPGTNGVGSLYFGANDDVDEGQIRYHNTRESMEIYTNSTERIRIDGQGNVGIGTTSPAEDLHVLDSTGTSVIRIVSNTDSAGIHFDGQASTETSGFFLGEVNGDFYLNEDHPLGTGVGTRWVVQNGTGNVGIGTTSPVSYTNFVALTVGGTGGSKTGLLKLRSDFSSGDGAEIFQNASGTTFLNVNGSTNALVYDASGNVGIGTQAPVAKLEIADAGIAAGSEFLRLGDDTFLTDVDQSNMLGIYGAQNSSTATIRLGSDGADITGFGGNIGIGTTTPLAQFHTTSDVRFSGVTTGSGDRSVCMTDSTGNLRKNNGACGTSTRDSKNDIEDLDVGLETVMKLQPKSFEFKHTLGERRIGFIAEDIEKVEPRLAQYNLDTGELQNVHYMEFTALNVKAIQEQQEMIEEKEERIDSLESENVAMKKSLCSLGAKEWC